MFESGFFFLLFWFACRELKSLVLDIENRFFRSDIVLLFRDSKEATLNFVLSFFNLVLLEIFVLEIKSYSLNMSSFVLEPILSIKNIEIITLKIVKENIL